MTWFAHASFRREREALLDYWDDVIAQSPVTPVPPATVPGELGTLVRTVHTADATNPDHPAYEDRLLQSLLARQKEITHMNAITVTAPPLSPPRPPARVPKSHRPAIPVRRWAIPALEIALIVFFILASIAGIWLAGREEPRIVAPPVVTPTEATSDVPMYRANPERTGVMPGPGIDGEPVILWQTTVSPMIYSSPAIVDGIAYFGATNGGFYAVDVATGEVRWTFITGAPVNASPTVTDGTVYFRTTDGPVTLYAVDAATGELRWNVPDLATQGAPLVADGVLYSGSHVGLAYAIDTATGDVLWTAEVANPGEPTVSWVAYDDGLVYVGTSQGALIALNASDGTETWRYTYENPAEGALIPAIANGLVYIGGNPGPDAIGHISAFDAKTGEVAWQVERAGGWGHPTVSGTVVYVVDQVNREIAAFDALTGEAKWTTTGADIVTEGPTLVGDTLYVMNGAAQMLALDAATGATLWTIQLDEVSQFAPVVAGGVAYVGTWAGTIYAIAGANSALLPVPTAAIDPAAASTPIAIPARDTLVAPFDPANVTVAWQAPGGDALSPAACDLAIDPTGVIYIADCINHTVARFSAEGDYLDSFGGKGTGPGQFTLETTTEGQAGIDFDAEGNIYVFDAFNHRIQKFDANRTFLMEWGKEGSGDGEFSAPRGKVDAVNQRVYVADKHNHRIQVFDLNGAYLTQWGEFGSGEGQFSRPVTVTVAPDGTIYVWDEGNQRIQHFGPDGQFLDQISSGLFIEGLRAGMWSMVVDPAGNLYALSYDNGVIYVYSPEGDLLVTLTEVPGFGPLAGPGALAFDANGNLLLALETEEGTLLVNLDLSPQATLPIAPAAS